MENINKTEEMIGELLNRKATPADFINFISDLLASERQRCVEETLIKVRDWSINKQYQTGGDLGDRDALFRQAGYSWAITDLQIFLDEAQSVIKKSEVK